MTMIYSCIRGSTDQQTVENPVTKFPYLFNFTQGKGQYEEYKKLYFLEVDRGTETLQIIRNKVTGYNLYRQQEIFKNFGAFPDFRVLFQCISEKRAANIRQSLTGLEGADLVWTTSAPQVNEHRIIQAQIWRDNEMNLKGILKAKAAI